MKVAGKDGIIPLIKLLFQDVELLLMPPAGSVHKDKGPADILIAAEDLHCPLSLFFAYIIGFAQDPIGIEAEEKHILIDEEIVFHTEKFFPEFGGRLMDLFICCHKIVIARYVKIGDFALIDGRQNLLPLGKEETPGGVFIIVAIDKIPYGDGKVRPHKIDFFQRILKDPLSGASGAVPYNGKGKILSLSGAELQVVPGLFLCGNFVIKRGFFCHDRLLILFGELP